MIPTDPIGIGQVNTDGGSRIAIASQHRHGDDLGAHALHLFFLEACIYRGMILKPLGVVADDLGASGRLLVDKVDC